jgi:hypothetical protein
LPTRRDSRHRPARARETEKRGRTFLLEDFSCVLLLRTKSVEKIDSLAS